MRMRRMAAGVLTVALLVALPACGKKTDEAARAAGVTPANALGFLTLSLDPSVDQKRNLYDIARKFPDAEARDDFTKTKEDLLSRMLEDSGLDYQEDVKPWLGSEVALAVLPGADGETVPRIALFIEQDDRDKAQAALDKANKKLAADGDSPIRFRFIDEFVVVGGTEDDDDATANAVLDLIEAQARSDEGDLSSNPDFTDVVDKLHGDRLLLGWVNTKEALRVFNEYIQSQDAGVGGPFDFNAVLKQAGPTAFDLHVGDSSVVFEGVAKTTQAPGGGDPKLTDSVPADSFGTLTVFDLRTMISDALAGMRQSGNDPLAGFEEETGIDLEADVLSWFGGESVLVSAPAPGGRAFPDFGLVVEPTDRAAAEAGLARMARALEERAEVSFERRSIAGGTAYIGPEDEGVQPSFGLFPDRFVVATTPAYMERLATAASPSFASGDAYRSVLGSTESTSTRFQLVLDIDAVREAFEKTFDGDDRGEYDAEARPNLEPLDAFGLIARRDGDIERFEMKLTFD